MFSKSTTILDRIASVTIGTSTSRLAIATAAVFLASTSVSLAAYSFLTVSGNNVGGNAATSQFSGTNGIIPVTHSFSAGGAGPSDNINSAIFPSNYSAILGFAGTGNVQGHLTQTLYGNTSVTTFLMTGYTISSANTVFGMWNTTDEVAQPAYRIELIDASNTAVPPTSFAPFGTGDNAGAGQPNGRHQMVLNPVTGDISAGATINGGVGTHTNALFWTGIPSTTKMIKVYGNLGPLAGNNQGDGVGYYFAELAVPEPTSITLFATGLFSVTAFRRRRKRSG